MSGRILYRIPGTVLVLLFWSFTLYGQRINFSAFAGEGITISSAQGPPAFNFNSKKRFVVSGSNETVTIQRGNEGDDAYAMVYEIVAAEGFDLQIDISAPSELRIDQDTNPDNHIPLVLTFAYENKGANSVVNARSNAIDAPVGMSSLIVPVIPRTTGTPGPPPDPFTGTSTSRPTGKVYLFIYGQAGPVGNIRAGLYEADISITVNYAGGDYE